MGSKNLVIDDQTAQAVVKRMLEVMPELSMFMREGDVNTKFFIRFQPLSERIKTAREKSNLTIKQVAQQLKFPQYKIKYIEDADVKHIHPDILKKYVDHLKMKKIFDAWLKGNPDIYAFIQENER